MASCGQSNEERSMKEILETPVNSTEHDFVLEQVEEAGIIEEEEMVEDLGDAEPPWESHDIEPPSMMFEIDAKEGVNLQSISQLKTWKRLIKRWRFKKKKHNLPCPW